MQPVEVTLKYQLADILELGPMTVAEITAVLDDQGIASDKTTVRRTLARGNFHQFGGKWGLGTGEK